MSEAGQTDQYKKKCIKSYDEKVERYISTYDKDYKGYPSNKKRYDIMRSLVRRYKPERILYIGCGACIPMVELIKKFGCFVIGIDFSEMMVQRGREVLKKNGLDPALAQLGDIEDINTFPDGRFDFAITAGVFTHLLDDGKALRNLNRKIKTGGILAVEFRNELFSCYSFNRFSYDFFLSALMADVNFPENMKRLIDNFFKNRFGISSEETVPSKSTHIKNGFINKFHNPLNINETLETYGFLWKENYFYHYHILPPLFEKINPALYHKLSLDLENPLDWRGYLMASAFVSEAEKIKDL